MIKQIWHCIVAMFTPRCKVCNLPKVKVVDYALDWKSFKQVAVSSYACPCGHDGKLYG